MISEITGFRAGNCSLRKKRLHMFEKFTERGRKIIIYAKEEAEKRQNDYLGTEHLLLALLREEDSLPVVIIKKMGLSIDE
ncbi:MAG: Clp protease N-terminal domain-containing protein, partial [Nitrospiraceae bacterium]|nr:Clp protease N-terminal domain-containing protein [Nitrospiraceae bacterium]